MKSKVFLSVITLLFILTLCKDSRIIEKDKLVKVYVDLLVIEEIYSNNIDSLTIGRKNIFDKYNITEDNYRYTLQKFSEDKEYWDDFFNKVYEYLDSLEIKKDII